MKRRSTRVRESSKEQRLSKRGSKFVERRTEEEEGEEEIFKSDENIIGKEDEKEISYQSTLADARRRYNLRQEYVYLIYNDLLKNIVKKWDNTDLQKKIIEKESFDELSRDSEEERLGESLEENDEASINREESNYANWKLYVPDEEAEIIFINDNSYIGRISRRKMEGEGIYHWRSGSRYKGEFEDNKIQGRGVLEWGDYGWYEGDFQDGYRHGKGTMVDKNYNLFYTGQWVKGRKHGEGYCRYENGDSYDGNWIMDKRDGSGYRIYSNGGCYVGDWKDDFRHGTGTMIWPNGDVYRGIWENGQMQGYGEYTWNAFFNDTLSWPREIRYKGEWYEGARCGKGQMILDCIGGARYSGEWKRNKKHGQGAIIGNNGEITEGNPFFENDILLPDSMNNLSVNNEETMEHNAKESNRKETNDKPRKLPKARVTTVLGPEQCISLQYYVDRLKVPETIDSSSSVVSLISGKCRVCEDKSCRCLEESQVRSTRDNENLPSRSKLKLSKTNLISTAATSTSSSPLKDSIIPPEMRKLEINELSSTVNREEHGAYNCITLHIPRIRKVYDIYSKIFCDVSPNCGLSMSRLSFWQLWRDCGIHKRGMSLVEIDNCLASNKSTLMEKSPYPFERIEIWQLIHALLEVSWHLYTKNGEHDETGYPGKLANGLHKFLTNDVYPNAGRSTGVLCGPERDIIPLQPAYQMYESIGNTHSTRQLLKAIFTIRDCQISTKTSTIKSTNPKFRVEGRNAVVVGEKLGYLSKRDKPLIHPESRIASTNQDQDESMHSLFVLRELGIEEFVEVMSVVCPSIKDTETGVIVDMEYELTFLEFLEILITAVKQLVLRRKVEREIVLKKSEAEDRASINLNTKNDEMRRSSIRLSAGGKSTRSKKKIVTKR